LICSSDDNDKRLAGAILPGSPSERGPQASFLSVPHAAPRRVKVPVLVVHHRDDEYSGSTFATALRYPRLFTASPRVGFIEVVGGESASADPCSGNNYHSFFGRRHEVMEAVDRWIAGEQISRVGDRRARHRLQDVGFQLSPKSFFPATGIFAVRMSPESASVM
jgi:hypothetical protein